MPGLSASDVDSGIRVVAAPSQSSYFAGEPFSVTITFTNTRSPQSGPSKPHTHKRGAHSISSAPLARPPTSPGTPRSSVTPVLTQPKRGEDVSTRKGLVGRSPPPKGGDESLELIEQRRKRLLGKSMSVTISPHELKQIGEGIVAKSVVQQSFNRDSRFSPASHRISSPLSRSDILPLPSNHPHKRKQSVFDGQVSPELIMATTTAPFSPYTPSSSSSTFSLALDPIAEGTLTPYASTPSIVSPSFETGPSFASLNGENSSSDSVSTHPIPRHGWRASQPPPLSQSSLGHGHPPSHLKLHPRTAFSSTFTPANTELILYSYAQLKGTLSLTAPSTPGNSFIHSDPNQPYTLNSIRAALLKRGVVGGGRMDITTSLQHPHPAPQHRRRPTHGRSSSFSSGLLSLLSPTSLVASASAPPGMLTPWTPTSASSLSPGPNSGTLAPPSPALGRLPNSKVVGLGLGVPGSPGINGAGTGSVADSNGIADEEINPGTPLPTFEVQPAMLAVDLSLMPGESRSYTYSIVLPDNLPPTFKGKCLKFSYELVIGTCRAASSSGAGTGSAPRSSNSVSRVMKVPIRVYNHVVVGRMPRPYDLLWPVSKPIGAGLPDSQGKVVEETSERTMGLGKSLLPNPLISSKGIAETFGDLQNYAQRLLMSFPDPLASGVRIKIPAESISPVAQNGTWHGNGVGALGWNAEEEGRRLEREREREEEGSLTGCREAVEILTRNPKKASYDVNKDGVKVAVLTFTKAAYRLGETVLGVVELNQRTSPARVLQLSAILEAHESLPSSISAPPAPRQLRRVHAEHYSSFTPCTLRTTFTLDIPSDASPAFQVRVGPPQPGAPPITLGGLEWKVRLCLLVAVASASAQPGTEDVKVRQMVRDGPRGEWGSSWCAPPGMAPMEKPLNARPTPMSPQERKQNNRQTWASFFASSILGPSEGAFHDGDEEEDEDEDNDGDQDGGGGGEDEGVYDGVKPDRAGGVGVGVNFGGGVEGWRDMKLETVECEVPIKLWPGNTAFKAVDVVFDV